MADALLLLFSSGVLSTRVNPDTFRIRFGYVWTGKFDLNTLRVDGNIFKSGKKKLQIKKYPDTCGRGLCLSPKILKTLFSFSLRTIVSPKRNKKQYFCEQRLYKQRVLWYFPTWSFNA